MVLMRVLSSSFSTRSSLLASASVRSSTGFSSASVLYFRWVTSNISFIYPQVMIEGWL